MIEQYPGRYVIQQVDGSIVLHLTANYYLSYMNIIV